MDFPVRYVSHNQMVLVFGWCRTSQGTTLTADSQQFILLWWIVAFPEAQHLETKPAAQRFLFWDKTHGESILKLQATVTKSLSQIPMRRLKSTYFHWVERCWKFWRKFWRKPWNCAPKISYVGTAAPSPHPPTASTWEGLPSGKAFGDRVGNPKSPQSTTIFINFHEEILGQLWF